MHAFLNFCGNRGCRLADADCKTYRQRVTGRVVVAKVQLQSKHAYRRSETSGCCTFWYVMQKGRQRIRQSCAKKDEVHAQRAGSNDERVVGGCMFRSHLLQRAHPLVELGTYAPPRTRALQMLRIVVTLMNYHLVLLASTQLATRPMGLPLLGSFNALRAMLQRCMRWAAA